MSLAAERRRRASVPPRGHDSRAAQALAYAAAQRRRHVAELQAFVRFPSISGQPRHTEDVARCAEWLAGHLRHIGLPRVRVISTPRHPFVFAESETVAGAPTLLVYGHYDVQPVDPLRDWDTPPFGAIIRGENLYGRGASDNKGQLFAHLKAIEAYLSSPGRLPLNVKCLFDGEEEIGSPHLRPLLERYGPRLSADVAVVSDMRMLGRDRPAVTYSLRGALSIEIDVQTAAQDLHSGHFGGAVRNAAQVLCEAVASLHDRDGRIAVPGVYDDVRRVSARERDYMAATAPSDEAIIQAARAFGAGGEPEFSLYENTTVRPALTVNGIDGGYRGPGGKGVVPARASAKLSFRLVPEQDPRRVGQLFRRHLRGVVPSGVRCRVRVGSGTSAYQIARTHPGVRAAATACRRVFPWPAVLIRSGGSLPAASVLAQTLRTPTVLLGFALPDDRPHAPNEKLHLPTFFRAIDTSVWFMAEVGSMKRSA